jgi:hypothetical protein
MGLRFPSPPTHSAPHLVQPEPERHLDIGRHQGADLQRRPSRQQTTVGLPGSGLSYRSSRTPYRAGSGNAAMIAVAVATVALILAAIFLQSS